VLEACQRIPNPYPELAKVIAMGKRVE